MIVATDIFYYTNNILFITFVYFNIIYSYTLSRIIYFTLLISFFFLSIVSVASTFYAIKTRKCPEGFNETRCIAFANYATIILWLAFVPLYLASTRNVIKVITLALSLSLNGLVQLICLFLPKVYVVLIKPEKNTRELVMARHAGSSYPTTPCTPITPELPSGLPFIIDRDRSKSLSFANHFRSDKISL